VGPEGLEPSPAWVRTRDAAANTSIPFFCFQSARRELNPRPAPYKDAALTVELRASESRAGGNRTHSGRLKVCCAAFTPRPHEVGRAYAFQSPSACHRFSSLLFGDSVVALGIELSTTRLSAGFGQPALDYHQSRAPRSRTETLLFPKQACFHLHLCPKRLKYPVGESNPCLRIESPRS
jgi:hypothetical protein